LKLHLHLRSMQVRERELQTVLDASERVVVHLATVGMAVSDQLDEALDQLAHRSLRTRFVRVPLERTSPWLSALRLTTMPALVCFQDGAIKVLFSPTPWAAHSN
jgi:hypothetical protein